MRAKRTALIALAACLSLWASGCTQDNPVIEGPVPTTVPAPPAQVTDEFTVPAAPAPEVIATSSPGS
ncbi:MAG: hypothetical protein ACT4OM_10405 [Actinomycetota bacterium]